MGNLMKTKKKKKYYPWKCFVDDSLQEQWQEPCSLSIASVSAGLSSRLVRSRSTVLVIGRTRHKISQHGGHGFFIYLMDKETVMGLSLIPSID